MAGKQIEWDKAGEHFYETGVDHGVLYLLNESGDAYDTGYAWNGLTSVAQNPSGAEDNPQYADNIKYLNLKSAEDFGLTIECFTTPPEFAACDGRAELQKGVTVGMQSRKTFGFSYRTKIGSDTKGDSAGYMLHLVYGCSATPSEKTYSTVNDSPEAATMSYEISTVPVNVGDNFKPTSIIEIDSRTVDGEKLTSFEKILYGDIATDPKLPMPSEVKEHFASEAV